MERHFRQMLRHRQKTTGSLLCVGLDPLVEKVPHPIKEEFVEVRPALMVEWWMKRIVDATAPFASMFKPQRAYWEALAGGEEALRNVVDHIKVNHPDIPVFLDCKRGDIDRTQTQYREAHFTLDGIDGMNYNGYMGKDTLKALVDPKFPGRALVGLGRTSNPRAWEIQDLETAEVRNFGRHYRLWEIMVKCILAWSEEFDVLENAGVVMGAAYPDASVTGGVYSLHLHTAREIVGDQLWFLIPGVGTQGGAVAETVWAAYRGPGSMAVNSSSGIIFASQDGDYEAAAAYKARCLRDELSLHFEMSASQ